MLRFVRCLLFGVLCSALLWFGLMYVWFVLFCVVVGVAWFALCCVVDYVFVCLFVVFSFVLFFVRCLLFVVFGRVLLWCDLV